MPLLRADPELICVGLPESAYPPVPAGLVAGRALIRNPAGQTIHSKPQVQAFADAVMAATGCDSFGTYIGHDSPSPDLALDCFVPKTPRALADAVAQFARDNYQRFGIWYVIRRQQIWNPLIGDYWRDMADRGSDTANHFDHDHVSFLDEPWGGPGPVPQPPAPPIPVPVPVPKEDNMASPFVLLTYGSGVALWHPSGDVVPLSSNKQVTDALARGDVVMDDLTAEQVDLITGAKHALTTGPALADDLRAALAGDEGLNATGGGRGR